MSRATPADSAQPALLVLDGIVKFADGRRIVDGVSASVAAGEIVCLLGPSGCGKTTTLRIAAGLERQDAGTVSIDGRIVADDRAFAAPEDRGVGLIFQDYALFPHLTVAGNVGFGLRDLSRADRAARVAAALDRVGLRSLAETYPHTLSGGEQQRVALARALAPQPRVMLMDEPFSGLDMRLRDAVRDETVAILRDAGTAVMLVTHEPQEAMRVGDRILLMRAGRIVQAGTPEDLFAHPVDRTAAEFFSEVNAFEGIVEKGAVATPLGPVPAAGLADGMAVDVVVRPTSLALDPAGVALRVVATRSLGHEMLIDAMPIDADGGTSPIRAIVRASGVPPAGETVLLRLEPGAALVYPRL